MQVQMQAKATFGFESFSMYVKSEIEVMYI